jgi:hypothetical protein
MFNNSHRNKIHIILHYMAYGRFKLWLEVMAWFSSIIKSGRHTSKNYVKQSATFILNILYASRWIGSIFTVSKNNFRTHTNGTKFNPLILSKQSLGDLITYVLVTAYPCCLSLSRREQRDTEQLSYILIVVNNYFLLGTYKIDTACTVHLVDLYYV